MDKTPKSLKKSLSWEDFSDNIIINPQKIIPSDQPDHTAKLDTLKMFDNNGNNLTKTPLYEALEKNWAELPERRKEYKNPLERVKWFRDLYFNIKHNGYKNHMDDNSFHHIHVIVKNGGLIYCYDGHNRLSILHHLNSKSPIEVRSYFDSDIKHARQLVKKSYRKTGSYQPLMHPAFADFQIKRGGIKAYKDRVRIITNFINFEPDNILDIGSCIGYYSTVLVKKYGAKAIGIEGNERWYTIAESLIDWYKRYYGAVEFINQLFEDYSSDGKFDLVLCLSVLHHYLKKSENATINFVNKIHQHSNRMAIIEVGSEKERQMQNIKHLTESPDDIYWGKLLNKTDFSKVIKSPDLAFDNRYFFKLER